MTDRIDASDQRMLDLLVDGELPDAQRRGLLNALEREPGGWRRCALAFLEAQCWGRELRTMTRDPAAASPVIHARPRHWWILSSGGAMLALAASVFLAFGLGLGTHALLTPGAGEPRFHDLAGGSASGFGTARPGLKSDGNNVTLVVDGPDGAPSPVKLPLVDQRQLEAGWPWNRPSPLPADVLQALERMGNQVRQQRELVPYQLEDGRRVVVPVDRIEVQPVNMRAYE
jgi:hypothetical protein